MKPAARTLRASTAAALAIAVTGCADPYTPPPPDRGSLPPGEQPAERLPRRAERVSPADLAATPEQAARRVAHLASNWTGDTAARQYAEIARSTVGDARRDALESAARLPTDPQLATDDAKSSGAVEAVATRRETSRRRELIVVTHENLTANGLRDSRWRVTLATAELRPRGWVLSRWEPQP